MTAKHLSAKLARTLGATALCAAFGTPAALATTIDLMIVYDNTATSWVNGKGGMAAFSQEAVNRMNQAAQNSGLDLTFRIVHTMTANYTTTANAQNCPDKDLDALRGGQGAFAEVHQARNTYGADLVAMLVDSGSAYGCVGVGYLLTSWKGSPDTAFTANVVRAVEISSTLTHEVGHNLGADHSKFQKSGPGPNTYLADYAAGWYFKGSNGTAYHTIMGYNNDGYGNFYQPAPLFSTPLKNYEGTPAGDAEDGDNTRLIAQTKDIVAAYRTSSSPPPPSTQSSLTNISTRGWVGTVDSVMIGGFIIEGSAPKKVLITAKGPTLAAAGVPSTLGDPNVTLYNANGQVLLSNDDWGQAGNASEIQKHHAKPRDAKEAAILTTLNPGVYTAIVRGANSSTGNALIEVYSVDGDSRLVNISTRGWVGTVDSVMIGGFIIEGSAPKKVLITAKGPTLAAAGVPSTLGDPNITLYNANGQVLLSNDDWGQAGNASEIQKHHAKPRDAKEAAILTTLNPGVYTAIVRGASSTTGNALVEVYSIE